MNLRCGLRVRARRMKPFYALEEVIPKHTGSKLAGIKCGGAAMLVLMNLIWRRLTFAMLIGMRSTLVR